MQGGAMNGLHVVLGATGGAGSAVVRELAGQGRRVRAVSHRKRADALPGVDYATADATDPAGLRDVCRGAAVVYHCVNVPYQEWSTRLLPIAPPFVMDWSKFRQAFGGRVTPLRDAIRETLEALRRAHHA